MSAIKVSGLTKKFGSFTAVEDLSFEVAENHVVGFLGLNGAGKTTTLRMLVGLSKATQGKIDIAGMPMEFGKVGSNKSIGYLPELPSMYQWMSGYEYLKFVIDLFGIGRYKRSAKISEVLKLVNLTDSKDKRIATYSGGMKQRLGIAQALLNDPKVIIMDEPVSALDPVGRKELLEIIKNLKTTRTVLFSTHVLSDVDKVCDDVIIIDHGKLISSGALSALKSQYATPILEVEFGKNLKNIESLVKQQKWAQKVEQDGNKLRVWLADGQTQNNLILKFLLTQNIEILSYGLKPPETEDLFIRLVGDRK